MRLSRSGSRMSLRASKVSFFLHISTTYPETMMTASMKGKSLLTLEEFTAEEIGQMIDLAVQLKAEKRARRFPERLKHRNVALVFLKPSCRTRASFVVASADEGACLQVFSKEEIRF